MQCTQACMHQRNHCQLETLRATAIPMMAAAAEATSAVPPTRATPRRPSDKWEGSEYSGGCCVTTVTWMCVCTTDRLKRLQAPTCTSQIVSITTPYFTCINCHPRLVHVCVWEGRACYAQVCIKLALFLPRLCFLLISCSSCFACRLWGSNWRRRSTKLLAVS